MEGACTLLSSTLPSRKRLGIEHVGLRQCFFETTLESFDGIGGTVGHGVLAKLVLLPDTQPNGVDWDTLLPGMVDSLGKRPASGLPVGDHNETKLSVSELLVALLHQPVHSLFNRLRQGCVPAGSSLADLAEECPVVIRPQRYTFSVAVR